MALITISGQVTDKDTEVGIPGASAVYSGVALVRVFADVNGNYTMQVDAPLGSISIAFDATGYKGVTSNRMVTAVTTVLSVSRKLPRA